MSLNPRDDYLRPPHPRRPPAHSSVSLLHSPRRNTVRAKTSPPQVSQVTSNPSSASDSSPSSLKPVVGKDDSGESSNADKWFEASNNTVTAHADNDPPFFLQQSSSEDKTPPQEHLHPGARQHMLTKVSPAMYAELQRLGTSASGSEEFRSVIDDLTIQNKKLKRRLKRYEKLHDAHLKDEKLFEVRVHGLPPQKKKELEDMLQKFTVDLQEQRGADSSASTFNMHDRMLPTLANTKTNLSHRSQFTDSAYASASASGQGGSSAPSASVNDRAGDAFKQSTSSRRQDIHSYLHDIPQGLLPKHPVAMSDKTKKKLIVRRLEQIFSGKGATKGAHHHPLQQQEVSQLAAKADRSESEALGQQAAAEGTREARIMQDDAEINSASKDGSAKDPSPQSCEFDATPHTDPAQHIAERDFAGKGASDNGPEQRPTRPLDLDPQRAQVPGDNIDYIRHLGFSPPDQYAERSPLEGHGWIYLNLLVNMAQLHTISVTPDFVKQALQEYSSRFELSADGRKVRWRRSSGYARTSSEADNTPASTSLDESADGQSPKKRTKLSHNSSASSTRGNKTSLTKSQQDKLFYTPMFYHRSNEDSDISSSDDEEAMDTQFYPTAAGGMNRKRETGGPIIFYNNARFCTDLSGDHKTEAAMVYNPILYHAATAQAVGTSPDRSSSDVASEKKGPLNDALDLPEAMDLDDNPIPSAMEINFPPQTPMTSSSEKSPLFMEASGIGGVYPADNFSIHVKTQQAQNDKLSPQTACKTMPARYLKHLADILDTDGHNSRSGSSAFHKEVVSSRQRDLPPSELPPASCFISLDGSDSESESDNESDVSVPTAALNAPPPAAAPQPIRTPLWDSDQEEYGEDDEDDDDDDASSEGSLDLLATARQLDPESIRESERLYDLEMAERLAEEIPAGSSAATAGGGSGFATPESGVDPQEAEAARKAHREKLMHARNSTSRLQRHGTSDSMATNGK